MATFVKITDKNGKTTGHKAVIRRTGWPTIAKTFRTKRDAEDWARRTEDEMVRGVFIQRAPAERTTIKAALERYRAEVLPSKRESTQRAEDRRIQILIDTLGSYSLAALTPEVIAKHRDARLKGDKDSNGEHIPRSNNTVRLELATLGHMYSVAIKEWGVGLTYNPVQGIRRPSPGAGRNRRLHSDEEQKLLEAVNAHSNPMLRWIVGIALETGMRLSEITTLKCRQVEVERRIVRLLETKNTSPRTVPLTVAAAHMFEEALAHPTRPVDTEYIFFGEPGKDGLRRPYVFSKVFGEIKERVGLKDFRFHDLRHEAVSRFVEAGLSDQEVASISGHKSMQMLRRYTHLRAEDLVSRIDQIGNKKERN